MKLLPRLAPWASALCHEVQKNDSLSLTAMFFFFFPNLAFNIIDFSKKIGCFVMITLVEFVVFFID